MDDYVEETKIIDLTEEEKQTELFVSIMKTKEELEIAMRNFEYAQDDLIDYYTYKIKATRSKFDYLVKKAKNQGLALDMLRKIEINKAI